MEYVLLAVLLLSALFIIVAVLFQKSADEGLSGAIKGGNDTYYGRDKAPGADKVWFKWTLIAAVVFAVAVLVVYIIQPDYWEGYLPDAWKQWSNYTESINGQ